MVCLEQIEFTPADWCDIAAAHVALIEPDAVTAKVVADKCTKNIWPLIAIKRDLNRVGTMVLDIERHPTGLLHLVVKFAYGSGGGLLAEMIEFAENLAASLGCSKMRLQTKRKVDRLALKNGYSVYSVIEKGI